MIGLLERFRNRKVTSKFDVDRLVDEVLVNTKGIDKIHIDNMPAGINGRAEVNYSDRKTKLFINESAMKVGSVDNFVALSVALFHESKHILQYNEMMSGVESEEILYSHIAAIGNDSYYEANYKHDVSEIEAESFGVFQTYYYILENYPDEDAFNLVKQYMQNRKSQGDTLYTYIDVDDVRTINDINMSFNKAYDECAKKHEPYFIKRVDDTAAKYLCENRNMWNKFMEVDDKFMSDKILTAIHIHNFPQHRYLVENNSHANVKELEALISNRELPNVLPESVSVEKQMC